MRAFQAVSSRLLKVILWRIGSLRHMFSSVSLPLHPAVMAPNFFTVAVAALLLVREVRPRAGAFDEVVSSAPDDSLFLMRHALYEIPPLLTVPPTFSPPSMRVRFFF